MGGDIPELLADVARVLPPPASFDERALRMYLHELEDIPPDLLRESLHRIVRTRTFFPKVCEIREAAVELALALPSETDALQQVEARLRWARLNEDDRGPAPPLDPLVLEALDHVGGFYVFKTAENPAAVRGMLLKRYRELRSNAVVDGQVGDLSRLAQLGPARRAVVSC